MNRIFSVNFWVQTFASAFITMVAFYVIKKVTANVNIPVVSEIAQSV